MKGLLENPGNIRCLLDDIAVLGEGLRRPGDVRLLENVPPQQIAADLSGDDHQGDGVHIGGGDARQQIGGAGAGGGDADARTSRNAGIAAGRVGRILFGTHQDVVDGAGRQSVVKGTDGRAGIAEGYLGSFHLQTFHHGNGAGHHRYHPILKASRAKSVR